MCEEDSLCNHNFHWYNDPQILLHTFQKAMSATDFLWLEIVSSKHNQMNDTCCKISYTSHQKMVRSRTLEVVERIQKHSWILLGWIPTRWILQQRWNQKPCLCTTLWPIQDEQTQCWQWHHLSLQHSMAGAWILAFQILWNHFFLFASDPHCSPTFCHKERFWNNFHGKEHIHAGFWTRKHCTPQEKDNLRNEEGSPHMCWLLWCWHWHHLSEICHLCRTPIRRKEWCDGLMQDSSVLFFPKHPKS